MDFSKLTDKEILEIATPLMDNLIEGSSQNNYEKHSKDFTPRLKSIVTQESFEKQRNQHRLGEFGKRELLSIIRKKTSIFVVWKQWFTQSSDEFLAEIIIVEQNEKLLVDHNWIR
jgi:predicted restriction endonuclease